MGVDVSLTGIPAFDTFELVKVGNLTITKAINSTVGTGSVSHNLGYVPVVLGYYDAGTAMQQLPIINFILAGVDGGKVYYYVSGGSVTKTTVEFDFYTYDTAGSYSQALTFNIKYFLFRIKANIS